MARKPSQPTGTREAWDAGPSENDLTTVDVSKHDSSLTPLNGRFGGTPTPLAVVGPISSGEITAQTSSAPESTGLTTGTPSSLPDPTRSTKLDPGFVHLVSGTLIDDYEVEKLLGAGGMGAVYGARHERLGRRVAIKVISPTLSRDHAAIERFEQEAQALARISHPNIVGVLNVGTLPGDGRSYYVMEWLDGESLHGRLERGAVDLDLALYVLDQIARGLEVAHKAGVVHRDLKPDNVWLQRVDNDPLPNVKILDFGLAKLRLHQRTVETAANVMFGTAAYMSPEQCQSARDVGPATDVYALGCIAFELLCGQLPFTYDNVPELIIAHQTEEPPSPLTLEPSLAPALAKLLAAMIAKDPDRRPSLEQIRDVLAKAIAAPSEATKPRALPRSPAPLRPPPARVATEVTTRSPVRLFAVLAGLVVLAVVIAAIVGGRSSGVAGARTRVTRPERANDADAAITITATPLSSFAVDASTVMTEPSPRPEPSPVTSHAHDETISPSMPGTVDAIANDAGTSVAVEPPPRHVAAESVPSDARTEQQPRHVPAPAPVGITKPPPARTPPAPSTKKRPPGKYVIFNPFKDKAPSK